jgi:hypothetical protein
VPRVFICPAIGVNCEGENVVYTGSVWHGTVEVSPNCTDSEPPVCTRFYTCINNGTYTLSSHLKLAYLTCLFALIPAGCPDQGATKMVCKTGYGGPLCGVCQEGHFKTTRDCKRCKHPQVGPIVGLVVGLLFTIAAIRSWVKKYERYLHRAGAFSHLKVVVSFVTVTTTLDHQFGKCTV